ncbi:2-hydroxy-3-oxopropionate reductase [Steroidobacter agaridevorans]|uniref:2-hydroxy-3-oxopropionate reductase n=1 Tax=Steroidobacter agaridevorans TaxID=2695856 RepID=A0A829YFU2_9GAMM|nr:dihydrofolate reductase family protein [Steroidobacter agaridevorans]GFE82090.1 2-hydroxy-3-oxopropionate reductase [Steroidobacter agaridevorans]GFE85522.1 2-hydroxy-3-oxopropionate reductase [Steroidobacter agaridevorans]
MSDSNARRPRVICHMTTSIDGRVVVDGWPEPLPKAVHRHYEAIHNRYDAQGWICGRVTMESFAGAARSEAEVAHEYHDEPRADFVAPGKHDSFAFAIDPSGRCAWRSSDISGDHVVAILTNRVSESYLEFLREQGVSYLLAGEKEMDLSLALEKIGTHFGVKTLLLEGGGRVNGSLLQAGLIDEVSLLIAPVTDGRIGTAALFDIEAENATPGSLVLEDLERFDDGFVWLRYRTPGGNE